MSNDRNTSPKSGDQGISREDAETFCLISLIGIKGCTSSELLSQLKISTVHQSAFDEVLQGLAASGMLLRDKDRITLTDQGQAWMGSIAVKIKG